MSAFRSTVRHSRTGTVLWASMDMPNWIPSGMHFPMVQWHHLRERRIGLSCCPHLTVSARAGPGFTSEVQHLIEVLLWESAALLFKRFAHGLKSYAPRKNLDEIWADG